MRRSLLQLTLFLLHTVTEGKSTAFSCSSVVDTSTGWSVYSAVRAFNGIKLKGEIPFTSSVMSLMVRATNTRNTPSHTAALARLLDLPALFIPSMLVSSAKYRRILPAVFLSL